MSEWYEAKDEDIDLDLKSREVEIFVTNNNFGNVYVTLKFSQVVALYEKLKRLIDDKS